MLTRKTDIWKEYNHIKSEKMEWESDGVRAQEAQLQKNSMSVMLNCQKVSF